MLQAKFETALEKFPFTPDTFFIVGVSGGADSVALLYLLHQTGYKCVAAHCNFQLRGTESMRDAHFTRKLAEQLKIPYREIVFETTHYAEQNKLSIEMACRELRYHWFEKLRQEVGADYIAIAHHENDSIETFFLNLIRGCSIDGLSGIAPINGHIVRPLLCSTRDEIEAYLQEQDIPYITDSTNLLDIYTRNKIRLNVIPLLQEINPAALTTIERTITHLQEVQKIYHHAIDTQKACCTQAIGNGDLEINIPLLLQQPSPQALLYELLHPYHFAHTTAYEILSHTEDRSGKQFLSSSHRLIWNRDKLILSPLPICDSNTAHYTIKSVEIKEKLPINLEIEKRPHRFGEKIPKTKEIACFDAAQLDFPLTLRHPHAGDWFIPFGMKGKQKLSNYFATHKFSLLDKERTWLLCRGEQIIWIIGHRTAQFAPIKEETSEIIVIKYII